MTDIIPVLSERSEKKNLNETRLRKIAIEASEQCGRGDVPYISPIETLDSVLDKLAKASNTEQKILHIVAFHIESATTARGVFEEIPTDEAVALFIGPEGGWSQSELDLFTQNNIQIVSLGSQVLRAETAVVAALSVVLL